MTLWCDLGTIAQYGVWVEGAEGPGTLAGRYRTRCEDATPSAAAGVMKRKFDELRENLDEFVEQNDYPALVVGCLLEELAYVTTFLQGLDEKHPEAYFLVFPQPFVTPAGYLDAVVESLHVQLAAAAEVRKERGEPAFPPLPAEVADGRLEPNTRLFALLQYLRSLLPNERDHTVVVGFLPLECRDLGGYLGLMGTILPLPDVQPWMVALRIVIYDDRSHRALLTALRNAQAENVLTYEVDLSTPALTNALTVDAANTSLPVAERMAALMQLAALDYSYRRYPDAIQKYGVLYTYYESQQSPSMQALCLLGVGDTLRAAGSPVPAKEALQRGVALAMEHKALAPLLNLLLSLVGVCSELGQHADAESYADSGTQVAAAVLNPFAYADLFQHKGDAQLAQGKLAEAMATYQRCEQICETYAYYYRWKLVLGRQIAWYESGHLTREASATRDRLMLVEELERRGEPAAQPAHAAAGGQPS